MGEENGLDSSLVCVGPKVARCGPLSNSIHSLPEKISRFDARKELFILSSLGSQSDGRLASRANSGTQRFNQRPSHKRAKQDLFEVTISDKTFLLYLTHCVVIHHFKYDF